MRGRWPVRWRLTLWYTALWLASMVLLGAGLYGGIRDELYDSFTDQLQRQTSLTQGAVQAGADGLSMNEQAVANLQDDEHFVRLLTRDGDAVVDTNEAVGGVPVEGSLIAAALAGDTRVTMYQVEGRAILVETSPVYRSDQVVGVLQVGASREDLDEALGLLLLGFGVAAPIGVLLAAIGGYMLAGRALAPVATITTLAGSIQANDLSARLGLNLPDDEIGRLAQTFDAMLARIEDAFERQRRFTGDAAHELRTPLTFLHSQVDYALARPRTSEEYREAFREIDGDLERVTRLVSSLLTLARADTGTLPLQLEPIDLAGTIAMLLEQYEPLAQEAGISLVSATTPVRLTGDADRLIQVLVNLLDNALRHTPVGGRIEVGCQPAGEQVRLWVQDSGEGIPVEHQQLVFDRFHRIDSGRARQRGGVGLGLSICKMIAEAHGGTIAISTPPGGGAHVELRLPVTP